jgi:GTP cyclohydrolase I
MLNSAGKEAIQNADVLRKVELDGEEHTATGLETPIRSDAFDMSDESKIERIQDKFGEIMTILGLDLDDESLKGTPRRVAKMYVNEIFQGLNPANKPTVTLFPNNYRYGQMLVERDITLHSYCEHHFVPILGKAHVAYVSSGKVIGLSKINRIVKYFAKRPQVQERLTEQIASELKSVLETDDVAVVIDADHMCVATRGVEDTGSSTVTAHYSGKFKETIYKTELFNHLSAK